MFAFEVDTKGGSTVIIKEDKLNTVTSLLHVVFVKRLKPDFVKKQTNKYKTFSTMLRLFKRWIALSRIQRKNIRETSCPIHWLEIYPVHSVIHLSTSGPRWKPSDRHNMSDSNHLCNLPVLVQISTSVLPTLTAVTSMRCVTILLDRTHARVQ